MDFLRASIKALFYDYPVDSVIESLKKGSPSLTDSFSRLVNIREPYYSQASMESLRKRLCHDWMGIGQIISESDEIIKVLRLPCIYAEESLDYTNTSYPVVDFPNLFRWNEMAKFVGEDLMTINYLAKKDVELGLNRCDFTWNSVLTHNNADLNRTLRNSGKGWCDIHLHFGASTDVFQLNWVSVMNDISREKKGVFARLTHPMDNPVIVAKKYDFDNLYQWCVLAAMIRWELYKYYIKNDSNAFKEQFYNDFERVSCKLPLVYYDDIDSLQSLLSYEVRDSLKTSDNKVFDYAIRENTASTDSPFMIYYGERYLLYQFYRDYWKEDNHICKIAKYVYLYELIKNQLRRELIQVNEIVGLGNFQEYKNRKNLLVNEGLGLTGKRFAVQTTMGEYEQDGMEVRITPQKTAKDYYNLMHGKYHKNIFGMGEFTTETSLQNRMTFVVHFIKSPCHEDNRYASVRENLKQQAEVLMEKVYKVEEKRNIVHRIVGIDAAGGETNCRPEVFAHLYRYCRKCGMKNFTYHVGEDFYDITEGLRSIDEAVRFLQLEEGCRLGHCIALGIDAALYYNQRHRKVIMPRQLLLDNIVWLLSQINKNHIKIDDDTKEQLSRQMSQLYLEIGYHQPFDFDIYCKSMMLRGDDIVKYNSQNSDWLTTAEDDSPLAKDARRDYSACQLCNEYFTDKNVFYNGFMQTAEFKAPYHYELLIKKLQINLMKRIRTKKICIETNPTSNVRIGRLTKYEELPLFQFVHIDDLDKLNMKITVNTDDKGIFTTSLYREFSLLALALTKQKVKGKKRWQDDRVYRYVGNLADAGQQNRFK